jgi:hypothetical protein
MSNTQIMICREIPGIASEIQVIPYGSYTTEEGTFLHDEVSADFVMKAFDAHKNDLVIDYEHQTLSGKEAPAAGWITRLINRGKAGIWAAVMWTEKAKLYIGNREYRYLSPVFLKRGSDNRVVKLVNAGLTNQPAIDGMVPLINKKTMPLRHEITSDIQGQVNNMLGIDPETFSLHVNTDREPTVSRTPCMSDPQLYVNSLMGIDSETFRKYNHKGS